MSAVDLSLEDIIAKERKGKAKAEGPKGKGRARSTPVRGVASNSGASGGGGGGVGRKPPPAGVAELREMRAFGRFRSSRPPLSQGNSKGKGTWKSDAGSAVGSGGAWGKAKGGAGKGKRTVVRYEPYAGGKDSYRGGKGAGWDEGWSSGWTPHEAAPSTRRVLIGNLDFGIMAEDLEELFAGFGVQRAWIDYDSTDRSLGTGGAVFEEMGAAVAACHRYHGSMIDGQTVYMELDHSKGKGKGK
mmetsp:Transcript_147023/g.382139  ORF Transcript_147023/g.382139 Transcript_147023/m.382139 type:complete len:243 (+) Transcript_147023:68-796(+)